MRRRTWPLALVVAVIAVAAVAAPAAAAELSIDAVDSPNSVTTDGSFDITVDVSGEDAGEVEAVLSTPEQLSCEPTGSQSISLDGGTGSASFSCSADAPGDYGGEIGVAVTGETDDGSTISDSTQTGVTVRAPASLTIATSADATSIDEGDTTSLTASIHNTGDVSTTYDASIAPGSGISAQLTSGSASGTVGGGETLFLEYELTGDTAGDHAVDLSVEGGNGQQLTEAETISVDDAGSGGGGGSSTDEQAASEAAVSVPESATVAEASSQMADDDPDQSGVQVSFEGTATTEGLSFETDDISPTDTVEVTEADAPPEGASPPGGDVRSVVQIDVPDEVADDPATIRFRLEADEIGTAPENVEMQRYDETADAWTSLETSVVEAGDDVVRFEAETPGFSVFAVVEQESTMTETATETDTGGLGTEADPTETQSVDETPIEADPTETDSEETPGFGIPVAVAALLAALVLGHRLRSPPVK